MVFDIANLDKGLLVPVLKKLMIDPTVPNNYRPIAVSVTTCGYVHHVLFYGHCFSE